MPEDLCRFCCQNHNCPDHGKRGTGNLTVCARYGKDKTRRMLYCRTCKARFSERKGTPLFDSQLTEEQAVSTVRAGPLSRRQVAIRPAVALSALPGPM